MPLTPFQFGEKIARQTKRAWGGAAAFTSSPPVPPAGTPGAQPKSDVAPKGVYNTADKSHPANTLLNDMSNNSARVSGGILSTVAGGVGTLATAPFAGATNAWNSLTPKSWNTSQEWSDGVNAAFNSSAEFAVNGARDVYGGLGGDMNYDTQHSWNQMQRGFNDPTVDQTSRNIANAAAWGGHGAWNLGQMVANPGKILPNAPRAGLAPTTWASAGSRLIPGARGGITTATGGRAVAGAGAVGTAINHADTAGNITELVNAGNRFMEEAAPPTPAPTTQFAAN